MESFRKPNGPTRKPFLAGLLSTLIPGAGQLYQRKPARGIAVLTTMLVLAYLINWGLDNFKIGQVSVGPMKTSWLFSLGALFWLWNVYDAVRMASGRSGSTFVGFVFPAAIVYIIAWQVTDVNLDRLVTRFSDARIVFNALIHPDLFERDKVSTAARTTFWVPCSDSPQALPQPGAPYGFATDKSCGSIGDPITVRGESFPPGATGLFYWVQLEGTNETQAREGGQAVTATIGPDGKFEARFKVPTVLGQSVFAGVEGIDPNHPLEYGIEVRSTQEVGTPRPSENFGDIIGRLKDGPPPDVLVRLGLVSKDATVPTPVAGKLFETIAIGVMATLFSTVLAVPLSFLAAHNITARAPGGTVIYYGMRTFFNVVRAVDTVIWGLIVIVWVGLGSFAGVIALTVHSVAALGKLLSEEIEHIDSGPIEAITATGANLVQVIRYAVVPQVVPPFLAYILLRWDINMRSATVVGFVAGGGIGFYVVETIRKGGYEQYAAALWAVAIVIIMVDNLSARWRERILVGETKTTVESPKPFYKSPRALVYVALGVALFVCSWQLTDIDLRKLLDPGPTFAKLVRDFAAIDLSPNVVETVIKQMLITIFQALVATTLGGLIALPSSFLAARNLTGRSIISIWIYYLTRGMFNVLRSIEALLYVAIFVFWVGIGPFAGALALAVTTFALIGKLFSEAIENIDPGPVEAITATGATRLQSIVYGVLPQIIPPFVSYSIYQWDINIRISTIIGFAGGGGIGLLLSTYFGQLQYHKAGTVVAVIVFVVALMDLASAKIRERMV